MATRHMSAGITAGMSDVDLGGTATSINRCMSSRCSPLLPHIEAARACQYKVPP